MKWVNEKTLAELKLAQLTIKVLQRDISANEEVGH
jgi:hypothetical protein